MIIVLKDKETDKIIQEFENINSWGVNYVEYLNGEYRNKIYCTDTEYFCLKEDNLIDNQ